MKLSESSLIRPLSALGKSSVVFGVVSIGLVGCGGSGGGGSSTGPASNPYAASYAGKFIDANKVIGNFSMTVSSDGTVNGTYGYSPALTFTGSVNTSGKGSITDSAGTSQITLGTSGRPTLGGGIGTSTDGAFFALTTNPNGLYSGFSGQYAGTVDDTTLAATGIIALSITSSGSMTGVNLVKINGTPTLVGVTGSVSSTGTFVNDVNGATVNGTVALSAGIISGALKENNGDNIQLSISQVTANP